ncbi:hypothetical protein GCM10010461_17010 [Microbacterium aurantiacum]
MPDLTGKERENLPPLLVDSERLRNAPHTRRSQSPQQKVNSRSPRPGRATHGISHARHDRGVPAAKDFLAVADAVIGSHRCADQL